MTAPRAAPRGHPKLRIGLLGMLLAVAASPAARAQPVPPPDRARQILALQLAPRSVRHPRSMSPAEAGAVWHGYLERIGKPPTLGAGAGTASGGH